MLDMKKFLRQRFSLYCTLFILFFLCGVIHASVAQVKFTAICPEKKIGKNDFLQVQFMVQNADNVESITPPAFKNFDIVSGPNHQSGMSIVNGKKDQYVAISFYLKPVTTGKFQIGKAVAAIDGKTYATEPINVEVTNSSSSSPSPSPGLTTSPFGNFSFDINPAPTSHVFDDYILKEGENVKEKVEKNIFVKLDLNKTSCYIGEPVIASYKLYTRLRSESVITKAPSFNGFSVSDIDLNPNGSVKVEKYKGRDYNVYTLRKVQLYPLQAGKLTLDPIVADNNITFLRQDYAGNQQGDLFYDMLRDFANETSPLGSVVEEKVTLKSEPVEVTVKPLPESNKPADFKGAVGDFTLHSSLDKTNFTTDDAGSLKITVEGSGNIQMINAPKINWPEGVDGYDPKVSEDIDKASVPMKGTKEFVYPFTVAKAGSYKMPSVSFAYFEPKSGKYKEANAPSIEVNVSKGTNAPKATLVKAKAGDQSEEDTWGIRSAIFSTAALALAFLLFFITRKRSEKPAAIPPLPNTEKRKQPSHPPAPRFASSQFVVPENPLEKAYEKLQAKNDREFYVVLNASFKKYLAAKFQVSVEELTRKRLNEELDKCDISLGTSLMVNALVDELELHLYTPSLNDLQMQSTYEKASEVISLMNKQKC